jgi:hypothetical protein
MIQNEDVSGLMFCVKIRNALVERAFGSSMLLEDAACTASRWW